jgi:hypothetical protein
MDRFISTDAGYPPLASFLTPSLSRYALTATIKIGHASRVMERTTLLYGTTFARRPPAQKSAQPA